MATSAVRHRDIGIIIVCLIGAYLALQGSDEIELHLSMYDELDLSRYKNGHFPTEHDHLPPPIITDLDGDGMNEIIAVTNLPSLKILSVQKQYFTKKLQPAVPKVVAEKSLVSGVRVIKGRRPVALATGYLTKYSPGKPRHQVIVVVTESWTVLCFDHKLKLLWRSTVNHLQDTLGLGQLRHKEMAVVITPHAPPGRSQRAGMVVVAGSMEQTRHAQDAESRQRSRRRRWQPQRGEGEGEGEERRDGGAGAGGATQGRWEDDEEELAWRVKQATHFSLYALSGTRGSLLWKHEAAPFQSQEASAAHKLHEQHQYKLNFNLGSSAHEFAVDWHYFRSSMLAALPHRWSGRDDTRLLLRHFSRHKAGQRPAAWSGGQQANPLTSSILGGAPLMPHDENEHEPQPNVIVAHLRNGIEVIHLLTGRSVCRLTLPPFSTYADVDGDRVVDSVTAIPGSHYAPPSDDDDDSSRRGGMATANAGGRGWGRGLGTGGMHNLPGCSAQVLSGVPAREALFNGSVCHRDDGLSALNLAGAVMGGGGGGGRSRREEEERVTVTDPIVFPSLASPAQQGSAAYTRNALTSAHSGGGGGGGGGGGPAHTVAAAAAAARRRPSRAAAATATGSGSVNAALQPLDSVFLVSTGVVTSYAPTGELNWQHPSVARWDVGGSWASGAALHPSLSHFTLRSRLGVERALAAAAHIATASKHHKTGKSGHHSHAHTGRPSPTAAAAATGGGGGAVSGRAALWDLLGSGSRVNTQLLLAVGEKHMALLTPQGQELSTAPCVGVPVSRPVLGDADNDGLNDVLLLTRHGYSLYVTRLSRGVRFLAVLLALAIVMMAATVALNYSGVIDEDDSNFRFNPRTASAAGRVRMKRSTD